MNRRKPGVILFTLFLGLILPILFACQSDSIGPYSGVLTYHNDNARTGANLNETILTPANVNAKQFGKLYSFTLDGLVFAQPLYVQDVDVRKHGRHNLVLVATEHDTIYAFDADGKSSAPVWKASFADSAAGVKPASPPYGMAGEMGITGTPVIDSRTGTLYAVTYTDENGQILYRLRALDIRSGIETVKGGTIIQASTPGTGDDTDGRGNVAFNPLQHLQRPGLLLSDGVIYIAFGSFGDRVPYHGWLMGYDAKTLKQAAVFNVTPNGSGGSLWMSGGAPAADDFGNIFVVTANGTFDASSGGSDYGQSVLKLSRVAAGMAVVDYFTPYNYSQLNDQDLDLGSGGIILVPKQVTPPMRLLITGGKDTTLYMTRRKSLGKFHQEGNQIVQLLPFGGGLLSTPAYWQNRVYVQQAYDLLRAYDLKDGELSPASNSTTPALYGGATPVVSANGNSNGIVWVEHTNAVQPQDSAILRAYDASDVSHELYNSTQAGPRDALAPAQGTRFTLPIVFNGKVYVASGNELDIFGLLGS